MNIPAKQMPWEWCTKIMLPRGRSWNYTVKVNDATVLRAKANNPAQLLRQIDLPRKSVVQVVRQ